MPDLLASTSLLPLTPARAPRAPVAAPATADFMAVLGELVLPPGAKLSGGRGQAIAGDGKNLPLEGEAGADAEEVKDPVVAWLPAGLAPVTADLAPLPDPALLAPQSGTGIDAAVAAALPAQAAGKPAAEAAEAPVVQTLTVESEAPLPEAPEAVPEIGTRGKGDAPVRERVFRPSPASLIIPQPVVSGASAAQTAAQVFAAAISASFDAPAAPRAADPVAMQAQTAATEQLRTTVQAMSGADQAPLDLSRDDWAGRMVDRIAALRDAAEATDTRIRLAPENLGNVDVSIRRDGDRLHVHFTAENPAARQLIAEAAPRLSELAEARGVKLGQTSVDAGTGGQSQGQPGQPQSHRPARPASAAAHTTQSSRDDRVA
ncbi:flagellar hook-length control protein FliK [Sphingomonas koreensis]|jgi:flagellar hook-length control protein FliK|nr:flagellar hook-length control protein FliK [Sphingomonas koreensis]MDC7812735.1 flagellar hook-length control protein FliK [Sphingomonas koreensis]